MNHGTMRIVTAAAGQALCLAAAVARPDLYSNGPFITNPGAGPGGTNVSALQTFQGNSSYGFSVQQSPSNYRLADDFTVPAGGWTISSIVFYGFQTDSGTTSSTFSSLNLRIWSGRPGDAGSVVVFGNTTANRLGASAWAGSYRASDDNLTAVNRPIFTVEAVLSPAPTLAAGSYWLDWQAAGTLVSGPWAVPVTLPNQPGAPSANARVYDGSTGQWINLRDGSGNHAAQEVAFLLRGTTGGPPPTCYANCDGGTIQPILNVNDFICFQTKYAAGNNYANCDGSTVPPVLNVNDFICFQTKYAQGCP